MRKTPTPEQIRDAVERLRSVAERNRERIEAQKRPTVRRWWADEDEDGEDE